MILEALYFALPVYLANMSPVLFRKLNILNIPINKKLFGSHKTYQGFLVGIIIAVLTVYIQYKLSLSINLINYSNYLLIGFLFGFGALIGDLIKSFFKRRLNIKPGQPWIPFDQLDFIIGGLLFISFIYIPPIKMIIFLLVITPIGHIIINYMGYCLGLREVKY